MDFLRANPFITRQEYLYELSVPYIAIMSADYTRQVYLTNEQIEAEKAKNNKITNAAGLMAALMGR